MPNDDRTNQLERNDRLVGLILTLLPVVYLFLSGQYLYSGLITVSSVLLVSIIGIGLFRPVSYLWMMFTRPLVLVLSRAVGLIVYIVCFSPGLLLRATGYLDFGSNKNSRDTQTETSVDQDFFKEEY